MQAYGSVFWGMAMVVLLALIGGSLMGRFACIRGSLAGVAVQSLAVSLVVSYLTSDGAAAHMATLLAIAAFMFSLVIGTAAALLTRRVRRERRAHLPGAKRALRRHSSSSSSSSCSSAS